MRRSIVNWWRYRGTRPFIVTGIRDGVVTAREIDRETGDILDGGERASFSHDSASYLAKGDITVLGRGR